jgi:dihydroorotate dehydrogenase (NAD+) catalytic subunit
VDLSVKIGGLELNNPVLLASGTCGYGPELSEYLDLGRLGGIVTKTVTLRPRLGNPPPRVAETPSGLLNSIGLENVGLDVFLRDKAPVLAELPTAVLVSVGGESVEEYVELVGALDGVNGMRAVELNISCPNVDRGMAFGSDPALAHEVVAACRERTRLPLVAKLTPNTGDMAGVAKACESAGADAVTVANTFLGLKIDLETRRPALRHGCGGLSGPAIRPLSVAKVWEVSKAVGIPIVGSGGICAPEDALEHIIAGATAVQVGTASFVNPGAAESVLDGLESYCERQGVSSLLELVGSLRVEGD